MPDSAMVAVSACLAGVGCRYDGGACPHPEVLALLEQGRALPVCPEQLGGLPTPRECIERRGESVLARSGVDVTEAVHRGAREALRLVRLAGCRRALLKTRSPACGVGDIHDGTFSGVLVPGLGVFAEMCRQAGLEVLGRG
jgi:uncharacterized protein YbbK (DUF523 family)